MCLLSICVLIYPENASDPSPRQEAYITSPREIHKRWKLKEMGCIDVQLYARIIRNTKVCTKVIAPLLILRFYFKHGAG
jgi:alpha-D-ribose 1-methylphosphonate 5-phosphate C-P lyase